MNDGYRSTIRKNRKLKYTSQILSYLCTSYQSVNEYKQDHLVNTSRSFHHSWFITRFITRLTWWVPLVEQELHTILEHLSSPSVFSGVHVTRSLVLCVCFVDCLAVVLSVLLFTDSDYPFGIFKLFMLNLGAVDHSNFIQEHETVKRNEIVWFGVWSAMAFDLEYDLLWLEYHLYYLSL